MNKWIGCGRLTKDPVVRYSTGENPIAIARYTLAVDRKFKRENQQSADFISCVALSKNGEFAEKYLKKGMKILVTGEIRTGSYINKEGQKVYTTEINVSEHEFVESKTNQEQTQNANNDFVSIPDGVDDEVPFL